LPKLIGSTQGLKPSQINRLNNLYRRRLPPAEVLLPEQARALAALSHEIGRQIGLVVDRKGEVRQVAVGGPDSLPHIDASRMRHGRARLAGVALVHTALGPSGLSQADQTALPQRRWDYLAVLNVDDQGLPGLVRVAHLLPQPEDGQDVRLLRPFMAGQTPHDMAALVQSLEDEFARLAPPLDVRAQAAAILVSVTTGSRQLAEEHMDELAELARSAGLEVRGRVVQRRQRLDPRTLMGPGRLAEVLLLALRQGASVVVFDQDLSPGQAHNLALLTDSDIKVIDRTQLILDIFAQRAATREGKLQVEMAQLRYLMPRLTSRDDGLSRLTGGIGGRGPGETRLEIDRRRVRERLYRLEKDLQEVGKQRQRRRDQRKRGGAPVLSIVGYTNAGKSTLLNTLTGSSVLSEDRLFATLDPTTRRLRFPQEREVIVTDTVGFIRDLPKELRQAFAATLEELAQADLLLHVADASNPMVEEQIAAVERTLDELDLTQAPTILVLNKIDKADPEAVTALVNRHQGWPVSALDPPSLRPLLAAIEGMAFGQNAGAV